MDLPETTVHRLLTDAEPGDYWLIDEDGRPITEERQGYLPAEDRWAQGQWRKWGRVDHVAPGTELPLNARVVVRNGRRVIMDWSLVEVSEVSSTTNKG